ncbi:unnamed protein product, partial [marine sediment metagenome]
KIIPVAAILFISFGWDVPYILPLSLSGALIYYIVSRLQALSLFREAYKKLDENKNSLKRESGKYTLFALAEEVGFNKHKSSRKARDAFSNAVIAFKREGYFTFPLLTQQTFAFNLKTSQIAREYLGIN